MRTSFYPRFMQYYRLCDDLEDNRAWVLGRVSDAQQSHAWRYSSPGFLEPATCVGLTAPVAHRGQYTDISFAHPNIPVVSAKVYDLLRYLAEVQFIPIQVEGRPVLYYILQVQHALPCVDEEASIFTKWEVGNPIRPDKAGQYHNFRELRLRTDQAFTPAIFRVAGWTLAIIIAEPVKQLLEAGKVTGVLYQPV